MLSYHVEHLGLLDTSESPIWEARSKLVIWRYIFEIPKKYSLEKWLKQTKQISYHTVILQITYSTSWFLSSSGCFRKNHGTMTPAQLQDYTSLLGMGTPVPETTHHWLKWKPLLNQERHMKNAIQERFCTKKRPFFQLTRFWTSKWFKHPNHEIKQNRISKPRFLCKISWSRIDLSLKNSGNNNKLSSSFHSHAISSDVPNGRNLPDMKLHSKPGQTIDNEY